jgi:carboxypeptidase T
MFLMKKSLTRIFHAIVLFTIVFSFKSFADTVVVKVEFDNKEQVQSIASKFPPEFINSHENFLILILDEKELSALKSMGLSYQIDEKSTKQSQTIKEAIKKQHSDVNLKSIPGFSCYRTVEETYNTMDSIVASHPNLASILDIGDSWEKANPGLGEPSDGYDLLVLKITNSAIPGPKPILYAMSSIHARELTPAELNTRFAEYLVNNYGTDADVTWIVDHREIHLLLQGNPDGRKKAETGQSKRKTENNNFCTGDDTRGVDMNRNFGFMWNQGTGSSGDECNQIFRGPNAISELETQAINNYIHTLFPDNRGPNLEDAAPLNTSGVYLDIHSVASQVLWPYGFDDPGTIPLAPNHTQLRTLGRKFAWYNNYLPQASNELYGADGASDDNAYGELGVASYTFELSGSGFGFDTNCSTFENTIYPDNLPALIYAAKVAETPYITASGPDIENLSLNETEVQPGESVTLSGIATDLHFNSSNGTEATQNIQSVQAYVNENPWDVGATAISLDASDGGFNSKSESFTGQISTTGLSGGQHIIYVVATDTDGVEGVPYAIYFNILDPAMLGTIEGQVTDSVNLSAISGVTVSAANQSIQTDSNGEYVLSLTAGNYNVSFQKVGFESRIDNNIDVVAQSSTDLDVSLNPICASFDDSVDSYSNISQADSAGWSHQATAGSDDWRIELSSGVNGSPAFVSTDVGSTENKFLMSPEMSVTDSSTLEFWHKYDFEVSGTNRYYDGGVLEITTNNGNSWTDLNSLITQGGYTQTLENGSSLGGQLVWGGLQSEFTKVEVDLSSYDGDDVKIRWRIGSDSSVGAGDWVIDDIKLMDPSACSNNDLIFENGFE